MGLAKAKHTARGFSNLTARGRMRMCVIDSSRAGDHAEIGSLESNDIYGTVSLHQSSETLGRGAVFITQSNNMKLDPYSKEYKQLQRRNMRYVKKLRKVSTKAEKIFKNFLDDNSIYYKFQKGFFKPFHRIVDFYIPYMRIIIEIDGKIHDYQVEKDFNKDSSFLKKRAFRTIRITNDEIFSGAFKIRQDIKELLLIAPHGSRRASRTKPPRG